MDNRAKATSLAWVDPRPVVTAILALRLRRGDVYSIRAPDPLVRDFGRAGISRSV